MNALRKYANIATRLCIRQTPSYLVWLGNVFPQIIRKNDKKNTQM
jgi:hypothetical protein